MIVLGIATVVLIVILIFVGIMMQYQNAGDSWPPTSSTCPDGWATAATGCAVPTTTATGGNTIGDTNTGNLSGSLSSSTTWATNIGGSGTTNYVVDPANAAWSKQGLTPQCALGAWANQNNIQWNGYSNFNGCKPKK